MKAVNGPMQTPRWGLRGVEDLGDGLSTVFVMESGFSMTNGTASQNGRMFGRQVYVGLQSNDYGTITLGRQYDLANAVLSMSPPRNSRPMARISATATTCSTPSASTTR